MTADPVKPRSPDEAALIRAVVAAPDDDLPRLVYADWLDDHGRPDRARLIRVQCSVEHLQAEAEALVARFGSEWSRDLHLAGATHCRYRRGFPEDVHMRLGDFLRNHDRLTDVTPVSRLTLRDCVSGDMDAELAAFARLPVVGQLRELDIGYVEPNRARYTFGGPAGVRALAASPHLTNLRDLILRCPRVGGEGVAAIADSPNFANLTRLVVTDPEAGRAESLRLLSGSPHLPKLESVELGGWAIPIPRRRGGGDAPANRPRTGPGVGR